LHEENKILVSDVQISKNIKFTYLLFFFSFFLASLFYYSITFNDQLAGFNSDDAIYLLLSDLYSFKTAGYETLYEILRTTSYFPPLYPMVLALFGVDSGNPALATNITVVIQLIALFISAYWIYKKTNNIYVSLASFIIFLILPGSLIFSQELWSEHLFMLFLYWCLIIINHKQINIKHWISIAALIALATLTTSIGVALIIAFILFLFANRIRFASLYSGISLIPFIYWNIIRESYFDRTSYLDTFLSTISDLSYYQILELFVKKITILYQSIFWIFSSIQTNFLHQFITNLFLLFFLTLILIELLDRFKNFKFDALFLLAYIAILFAWPYDSVFFVSRFIYPLFPLLAFYFINRYTLYITKYKFSLATHIFLFGLIFISITPSSYQFLNRAYADVETELIPFRRDRQWLMTDDVEIAKILINNSYFTIKSLNEMRSIVPVNECIYSIQAPIIMLHAKRVSSILPHPEVSDEEFTLGTSTCNYILAMPVYDATGNYPEFYPMQRLSNDDYHEVAYFKDQKNNAEIFLLEKFSNTTF